MDRPPPARLRAVPLALLLTLAALPFPAWTTGAAAVHPSHADASVRAGFPTGLAVEPPAGPVADTVARGMVPADYYRVADVGDPQISPDGSVVAFTLRRVSEDRRSREGGIWIVSADGGEEPRRFTRGDADRLPRWSPDGDRLAFVRAVDDAPQIHLIPRDGGEAQAVTSLERGSVRSFEWFPDGQRLLLTLNLEPGVEDPTEPEDDEKDEPSPDVTVIRHAVYKSDGTGYLDERRLHLWALDVESGSLERITPGDSLWNDRNAHIAPDGNRIAFDRDSSGEEYDGSFNRDVFVVAARGGDPPLLRQPEGRAEAPVWSPDGRLLAYRFTPGIYERSHVHVVDPGDGEARVLTRDVDLIPTSLTWHPDGSHLLFTADRQGSRPLLRLEVDGSGYRPVLGEGGSVSAFSLSADGARIAYLFEHAAAPAELWVASADGSGTRALTDFNREFRDQVVLNRLEEFRFANAGGGETHGFFLEPVGRREGETYPLILNIKGGPGGMWGQQWFHEAQMMAGAGYAVAFVNYRGSTGYGHDHQSAVRLDYGGADAEDNLQAVDEVLARWDWIDPDRLFVTGGSHGGFLTNWLTTRTDRFRAAVTQRSVSNWISEAGTQEYPPRRMAEEFGGTIWENFDLYWDRSPLAHADRVTTPTLVIHSDGDLITPLGQGEEWYFALKALGVPTEMAVFHGEAHGLSRTGTPVNLVERLRRILEWFERWDVEPAPAR